MLVGVFSVDLGGYVFVVGFDVGLGDDFGINCGLNWDFEVLLWDDFFEFGGNFVVLFFGKVVVGNEV